MTTKTSTARDVSSELAFLTRALKAPPLREAVGRLADRALTEGWSHEEFWAACLQREVATRDAHGGEGRIKVLGFPPARGWRISTSTTPRGGHPLASAERRHRQLSVPDPCPAGVEIHEAVSASPQIASQTSASAHCVCCWMRPTRYERPNRESAPLPRWVSTARRAFVVIGVIRSPRTDENRAAASSHKPSRGANSAVESF